MLLKKSDGVLVQDRLEKESKTINEKLAKRKQGIKANCQILVRRK